MGRQLDQESREELIIACKKLIKDTNFKVFTDYLISISKDIVEDVVMSTDHTKDDDTLGKEMRLATLRVKAIKDVVSFPEQFAMLEEVKHNPSLDDLDPWSKKKDNKKQ